MEGTTRGTQFSLEIFYERDGDREFAEEESQKLLALVGLLAPHIELTVKVVKAVCIRWSAHHDRLTPYHHSLDGRSQTLVITNEDIGAHGWGAEEYGCVSKQKMLCKQRHGGNSAEITIHEWLHTIEGKAVGEWRVPCVDDGETRYGFKESDCPRGSDGQPQWLDWYRFALEGPEPRVAREKTGR